MQTFQHSEYNHHSRIIQEVMNDLTTLQLWEEIAASIAMKHEAHSLELLQEIVKLWATVRCFSFTTGCNILLQKSTGKNQGTRRSLKSKATGKES